MTASNRPSFRSEAGSARFNILCTLAIAFLFLPATLHAQQMAAIRFVPPVVTLAVGERATVEVLLDGLGVPGLAAFQIGLSVDPALVSIENPNEAFRGMVLPFVPLGDDPALCLAVRSVTTCTDPVWMLTSSGRMPLGTDFADSVSGHVEFAYASSGAQGLAVGSGTLGLITVLGTQTGATLLTIQDSIVADNADPPLPAAVAVDPLVIVVGTGLPDVDVDGVPDNVDNCVAVPNGPLLPASGVQLDGDRDGFGNACDGDLNNDGIVNFLDLGVLKSRFNGPDPTADFNGDGIVNFLDLGRLKALFNLPPGPSGRVP